MYVCAHTLTHTVQQHTDTQNYTAEAAINIYPSSSTSYLFHPTELISEGQRGGEEIQREKEGMGEVVEWEMRRETKRKEHKKVQMILQMNIKHLSAEGEGSKT